MRKAWLKMAEHQAAADGSSARGVVLTAEGRNVAFPGMGTMKFEGVNRMTVDRLYAERKHIQKMVVIYAILFVAVSRPLPR